MSDRKPSFRIWFTNLGAIVFGLVVGLECTLIYRSHSLLRHYYNVFRFEPFLAFLKLLGFLEAAAILAELMAFAGLLPRVRLVLACISFALIGGALFGGSAIIGTDVLGHMRPCGWNSIAHSFLLKGVLFSEPSLGFALAYFPNVLNIGVSQV